MRILGIDPGIERCGWGVVEEDQGKLKTLDCGCLLTSKKDDVSKRLEDLYNQLSNLLKKEKPDFVAIEDLFFNSNAKTAIIVGQARGVIMLSVQQASIPIYSYSPLQIKMSITGYGRAEKSQIQQMVKNVLHLAQIPKPDDVADALAVALTYSFVNKFSNKLK